MLDTFATFHEFNPVPMKAALFTNMFSMLVAEPVFQLERSGLTQVPQVVGAANVSRKLTTLLTSQELMPTPVNAVASKNICSMDVTLAEFHPLTEPLNALA